MGEANRRGSFEQRVIQAQTLPDGVCSIRIQISVVGPVNVPDVGEMITIEAGIKTGKDVDTIAFAAKTGKLPEAIDIAAKLVKDFLANPQAAFRKKIGLGDLSE